MNTQCSVHSTNTARPKNLNWVALTNSTESPFQQVLVYVGPPTPDPSAFVSHTSDDLSWAYSPRFELRLDSALRAIEAGEFDTVNTIDELIEYIDAQGKKAKH